MAPIVLAKLEAQIRDSFSISRISLTGEMIPYRLAYHRIIFVSSGQGTFLIDDKEFILSGNQLFLISQGQVFCSHAQENIEGYEISFGDSFWERTPESANNCKAVLFNNASNNQCLPIQQNDSEDLLPLLKMLLEEYNSSPYINKLDALAAFLKIIMIKIANLNASLAKGFDNFEKQMYRKFLEAVSKDYFCRHEVSDYARQLNITPRRLSELCKRSSGKTAKDIINGQLIAEAKRHLQFSSIAVKEIAIRLSFPSPEQFSHFFKKNVQASPSDYRTYFIGISA